jgi:hypothetical protein
MVRLALVCRVMSDVLRGAGGGSPEPFAALECGTIFLPSRSDVAGSLFSIMVGAADPLNIILAISRPLIILLKEPSMNAFATTPRVISFASQFLVDHLARSIAHYRRLSLELAPLPLIFTMSLAAAMMIGCEGYRNTIRGMNHSLGAIDPRDLQQADAYQQALPQYLKLPPNQVKVEPGSGITNVTIKGVKSDSERNRISAALQDLNTKNPQLNPLKWDFL